MRVFLWDVFFYIFHIFLLLFNDLRAHEHNKFVTKKIKKYLKQSALMTKNTESFLCVDWIKSDCNEFKRDVSSSQLWQKQNMHFGRDSKAVISNDYRCYGIRLLLFEPAYFFANMLQAIMLLLSRILWHFIELSNLFIQINFQFEIIFSEEHKIANAS